MLQHRGCNTRLLTGHIGHGELAAINDQTTRTLDSCESPAHHSDHPAHHQVSLVAYHQREIKADIVCTQAVQCSLKLHEKHIIIAQDQHVHCCMHDSKGELE
jgi:hypothetical protein